MRAHPSARFVCATVTALGLVTARPALASLITWEFRGFTSASGIVIPEVPVGSPVILDWTFDPNEPNECAPGSGVGQFNHQSATLQLGSYFYTATGFLDAWGHGISGCAASFPGQMELRFTNWRGPNFEDDGLVLLFSDFPFSAGLYWSNPEGPVIPTTPPSTALWEGPLFLVPPGRDAVFRAEVISTPEPTTIALVAGGLLIGCRRRRRRH
jgi:hypothetical protein